jgi:hypothetical protein
VKVSRRMGVAGSKSGWHGSYPGGRSARSNFSHLFEARYNQPMPYQMNPGVRRTCSECGETFTAVIANNLTCSPACALFRKTALQRARRRSRRTDTFVR